MRRSLFATSSSLAAIAFVLSSGVSSAQASCQVDGMADAMASNPQTGQTINCEGSLDNEGVVNSDANDVTVNIVAPSGGISVTGQAGVRLGTGATVDVASGSNRPINTSGDNAPGIDVGNGATITVGGQVTTSGGNSGAVRTGDDSDVTVNGTVRSGGGMSDGVSIGANSTVTLNDGGLVTTGNSNSDAVVLRGDGSTLNVNSGARLTTSSGMSNPVKVDGNMATLNIGGEVRSSSGNATAILVNGNDAMITLRDGGFVTAQSSNSNAIEVTGSGATFTLERGSEVRISSGNSVGIVTGTDATLDVSGTISASSSNSQGIVLGDGSTLNIREMGIISTSSSESQAVRIAEDAMSATINVESGGEIDAVGAQAVVDEGMTATTLNVFGTVFGGSSDPVLELRGGDDEVIIESGGLIRATSANPVIDFGAGSDTLTINAPDGLTGSAKLADFGDGMDTLNIRAGNYTSSRFNAAETVNVGSDSSGNGGENATAKLALRSARANAPGGGSGSGPHYTVDDSQPQQTVNVSGNGSVNVTEGGSVQNVNSSDGGSANVDNGGRAENVNSSNGGSANVNNGGSAGSVNATDGGTANVNNGGRADSTTAGNGGSVSVGNGGDGGRVQSDAGGNVDVSNGGRARVDSGSGNGGTINFQSGSTVDMDASGSSRRQSMRIDGANFEAGTNTNIRNSVFLTGQSTGDSVSVGLEPDAFVNGVAGRGVTNNNSLNAARGLDRIAQAGTDEAALERLDGIVLADAETIPSLFADISREADVQIAAAGILGAQGFTDMLRAGSLPMVDSGMGLGDNVGVWVGASGHFVDVDQREGASGFTTNGQTYAGGLEVDVSLFGLDEARAGVAVAYTETDVEDLTVDEDATSWSLGLYAGWTGGPGRFDVAASYSRTDLQSQTLDENADIFGGRAELGFDAFGDANNGFNLSPFVRVSGTHASFSDFDAQGAVGTAFIDEDFTQGVAGAGLRIGDTDFGQGVIRVSAEAAYERVFGDRDVVFTGDVANTPSAFTVGQRVADRDRLATGAQIGLVAGNGLGLALRYDGKYGSNVTDHLASVRVTGRF